MHSKLVLILKLKLVQNHFYEISHSFLQYKFSTSLTLMSTARLFILLLSDKAMVMNVQYLEKEKN